MSQVVTKTGQGDALDVALADFEFRLAMFQTSDDAIREDTDTDGVLEAMMGRTGEDEVSDAELFEVAQALELGSVLVVSRITAFARSKGVHRGQSKGCSCL